MSTNATATADEEEAAEQDNAPNDAGDDLPVQPSDTDLEEISGVGESKAKALIKEGFTSKADVRDASIEDLASVTGVSEVRAENYKAAIAEDETDAAEDDDSNEEKEEEASGSDNEPTESKEEAEVADEDDDAESDQDEKADEQEADTDADAGAENESEAEGAAASMDSAANTSVPKTEGTPGFMEAALEKQYLDALFERVSVHADECKLHVSPDGLRVVVVDAANVSMGDMDLGRRAFERLETDTGVLGINVDRIQDVLSLAESNGDLVQLALDPETRKLKVEISGLEATIALIDPDSIRQEPELPDLELPTEVDLPASEIKNGIKAADMVADHVAFSSDPDAEELIISAEGDTDDVQKFITSDDYDAFITGHDQNTSLFSLDYLKDIHKPLEKSTSTTLRLGDEFPIIWSHAFADSHGRCTTMLAPRIDGN